MYPATVDAYREETATADNMRPSLDCRAASPRDCLNHDHLETYRMRGRPRRTRARLGHKAVPCPVRTHPGRWLIRRRRGECISSSWRFAEWPGESGEALEGAPRLRESEREAGKFNCRSRNPDKRKRLAFPTTCACGKRGITICQRRGVKAVGRWRKISCR